MAAQSSLLSDAQVHAFCRDGFCVIQPDVAPRLHKLVAEQITALLAAYAHTHNQFCVSAALPVAGGSGPLPLTE